MVDADNMVIFTKRASFLVDNKGTIEYLTRNDYRFELELEILPFADVTSLARFSTLVPLFLQEKGHDIRTVIPKYGYVLGYVSGVYRVCIGMYRSSAARMALECRNTKGV